MPEEWVVIQTRGSPEVEIVLKALILHILYLQFSKDLTRGAHDVAKWVPFLGEI